MATHHDTLLTGDFCCRMRRMTRRGSGRELRRRCQRPASRSGPRHPDTGKLRQLPGPVRWEGEGRAVSLIGVTAVSPPRTLGVLIILKFTTVNPAQGPAGIPRYRALAPQSPETDSGPRAPPLTASRAASRTPGAGAPGVRGALGPARTTARTGRMTATTTATTSTTTTAMTMATPENRRPLHNRRSNPSFRVVSTQTSPCSPGLPCCGGCGGWRGGGRGEAAVLRWPARGPSAPQGRQGGQGPQRPVSGFLSRVGGRAVSATAVGLGTMADTITGTITTENTTLKQRVRRLTADNRALDERLKAARSNLRFQDCRVADLEARIADPGTAT